MPRPAGGGGVPDGPRHRPDAAAGDDAGLPGRKRRRPAGRRRDASAPAGGRADDLERGAPVEPAGSAGAAVRPAQPLRLRCPAEPVARSRRGDGGLSGRTHLHRHAPAGGGLGGRAARDVHRRGLHDSKSRRSGRGRRPFFSLSSTASSGSRPWTSGASARCFARPMPFARWRSSCRFFPPTASRDRTSRRPGTTERRSRTAPTGWSRGSPASRSSSRATRRTGGRGATSTASSFASCPTTPRRTVCSSPASWTRIRWTRRSSPGRRRTRGSPTAAVSSSSTTSIGATWRSTRSLPLFEDARVRRALTMLSDRAVDRPGALPRLGARHLRALGAGLAGLRRIDRAAAVRSRGREGPARRGRLARLQRQRDARSERTRVRVRPLRVGGLGDRAPGRRDARVRARPRRSPGPRADHGMGGVHRARGRRRVRGRFARPGPQSTRIRTRTPTGTPRSARRTGSTPAATEIAEADRLMEEARRELDASKRDALFHRLHRIFRDDAPVDLSRQFDAEVRPGSRRPGPHDVPAGAVGHLAGTARHGGKRRGPRGRPPGSPRHDRATSCAASSSRCRPSSESS